jgi:hypothetical protein
LNLKVDYETFYYQMNRLWKFYCKPSI